VAWEGFREGKYVHDAGGAILKRRRREEKCDVMMGRDWVRLFDLRWVVCSGGLGWISVKNLMIGLMK